MQRGKKTLGKGATSGTGGRKRTGKARTSTTGKQIAKAQPRGTKKRQAWDNRDTY